MFNLILLDLRRFVSVIGLYTLLAIINLQVSYAQVQRLIPEEHKQIINQLPDGVKASIVYVSQLPQLEKVLTSLEKGTGKQYTVITSAQVPFGAAHYEGVIIMHTDLLPAKNRYKSGVVFMMIHAWYHAYLDHPNSYAPNEEGEWVYQELTKELERETDSMTALFLAHYKPYNTSGISDYLYYLDQNHVDKDDRKSISKVLKMIKIERAKANRASFREYKASSKSRVSRLNCVHLLHPMGDWKPCVHFEHTWDGRPPNQRPCTHKSHSEGDYESCRHYMHPQGDGNLSDQ